VTAERAKSRYSAMLRIRASEEALQKLFADGRIPGFVHLSIGQEAVAVGVSSCLRDADTVSSNHRGHGHTLAKGVELEPFFAEILGRETGLCRGRGGSMHVADFSKGMLGANGIVGAGLPITTGSALALKLLGKGDIAVVYFGDGALAQGLVHECINLSALWSLPVMFVCENNGWSEFSPTSRQMATSLRKLADAFGVEYRAVDGNRVSEVAATAETLVAGMRKAPAPAILECATTRVRGHFEGDRQDYRTASEIQSLPARDPLSLARAEMQVEGVPPDWFDEVAKQIAVEVNNAVAKALTAPPPIDADLAAGVYAGMGSK